MSMFEHTFPTRYEYFEAWLTPREWATWKRYSLYYFAEITDSDRKAKELRTEYLNRRHNFNSMPRSEVQILFETMIDEYLTWRNTPEGLDHWQMVARRIRPIRTLQTNRHDTIRIF